MRTPVFWKEGARTERGPAQWQGVSGQPLCLEPSELSGGREGGREAFLEEGGFPTIQRAYIGILRARREALELKEQPVEG